MAPNSEELERIQRWFQSAITQPGAIQEDLERIVLPSKALNPTQRLSIYANMYVDRLLDILANEFPTVRQLLGPEDFTAVAKLYILNYPSTHYSLAHLGKNFPQFLLDDIDEEKYPQRNFAAAVATVERTMEDVFDEKQDEPLAFEELQSIDPNNWNQVRLTTISALRLLQLPYPVNEYISAHRDGQSSDIPAANTSYVVVYRHNYQVWRKDLNEHQFTILCELQAGHTLGDAVSASSELPNNDTAALANSLFEWFHDWTAEGFFHQVAYVEERT